MVSYTARTVCWKEPPGTCFMDEFENTKVSCDILPRWEMETRELGRAAGS